MKAILVACLAIALPALAFQAAAEPTRFTGKCNTQSTNTVTLAVAAGFMDDFARISATDPQRGADLFRRLWEPQSMNQYDVAGTPMLQLEYDPRQDIAQIAQEIEADPVLALQGAGPVQTSAPSCAGALGVRTVVTEYRNRILDHYFLSSSREENQAIDTGLAGPGWERTGEGFTTQTPGLCTGSPVYRFYGPLAHSHFFTPDAQECGNVRKSGTGWLYEGIAFGGVLPANGECPAFKKPVWRLYNGRAAQNDSNHRYVARGALASEMALRGWAVEGVAFCVNP